ncbi:MAG: AAA family ATPase [Pseudomonadota bacterium]
MPAIENSDGSDNFKMQPGLANSDKAIAAIYRSKEMVRAIEKLNHLVNFGNLLLLITGEHGVGKTTLLNEFGRQIGKEFKVCFVQADKHIHTHSLFEAMLRSFRLSDMEEPSSFTVHAFQRLLLEHSTPEKKVLLIDNAEQLKPEVLLQLSHLVIEQRKLNDPLLHVILFADSSLNNVVTETVFNDLRSDGIHHIELKGIRVGEIESFLNTAIKDANLQDVNFSEEELKNIHAKSRGVPKRIVEESFNLIHEPEEDNIPTLTNDEDLTLDFLDTDEKDKQQSSRNILLLTVSFLIVAAGLSYLFVDSSIFSGSQPELESETEMRLPNDSDILLASEPEQTPQPVKDQNQKTQIEDDIETDSVVSSQNQEFNATQESETNDFTEDDTIKTVDLTTNQETSSTVDASVVKNDDTPEVTPKPTTPESEPQMSVTESQEEQKVVSSTTQKNEPAKEVVNKSENMASEEAATKESAGRFSNFEQQLLKADSTALTLQIAGFSKESGAQAFLKEHASLGDMGFYKKNLNGKPWFVVIYGNFADRDKANSAKANLPSALQKANPWTKSMASVQSEIRQ